MRKFILAAMVGFSLTLGGCGTLQNTWDVVTQAKVSPTVVIVAANTFDALEVAATKYLRLKKCSAVTGPICRDPAATKALIPAVRSGRVARNALVQFLKDHPGELGSAGAYDALNASIATLKNVFAQYKIGGAQ